LIPFPTPHFSPIVLSREIGPKLLSYPQEAGWDNVNGCVLVFVLSKRHTGKKKKLPPTLSHQWFHSPEATSVTSFLRRQFGYLWYSGVMKVFQT